MMTFHFITSTIINWHPSICFFAPFQPGKVYTLERDYAVALQRAADLESEVQSMKDTLQMHIESTVNAGSTGAAPKILFNDTADNNLNALNVPTQGGITFFHAST